jgi:hypothetical protein
MSSIVRPGRKASDHYLSDSLTTVEVANVISRPPRIPDDPLGVQPGFLALPVVAPSTGSVNWEVTGEAIAV